MIEIDTESVKKIIVVRRGALGDVLMITPFIRALKEHFPNSKIDVLVHSKSSVVFQNNPYINEVLTLDHTNPLSFIEHRRITNYIRNQNYNLAIVLETKKFFYKLIRNAHIKSIIGLTPLAEHYYSLDEKKHVIENHLALFERFFGKRDLSPKMEIFPSDEHKRKVFNLLNEIKSKYCNDYKFVVIHLGTSATDKRFIKKGYGLRFWGVEKFASLGDWFNSYKNIKVIFTGSKQEKKLVDEVKSKMKTDVVDFCGKLSFLELGVLIEQSSLFVSGDTGPLHLATAVGTPVVAIFGPSLWQQTGPFAPDDKKLLVRKSIDCSPCWGTERRKKCKKNICLQNLTFEEVRDEIKNKYRNILNV